MKISEQIQEIAERWGDPLEISRLRPDDFDFIKPKNRDYDVLQCNNQPSVSTKRGHQFPFAFMMTASGLTDHGLHSPHPLPYTHIDIAGSCSEEDDFVSLPTASPLLALFARYILPKLNL